MNDREMLEKLENRYLEPDDLELFCHCAYCGDQIYVGDEVWNIDSEIIHEEELEEYIKKNYGYKFIVSSEDKRELERSEREWAYIKNY